MTFEWKEYLELAEEICGASMGTDMEARERAAISRAYYASFCMARNRLIPVFGQPPENGQAHAWVQGKYERHSNKKWRSVGNNLSRMRVIRNKADYDDTFPNCSNECSNAINWSKDTLRALSEIF
jgi:uncharacterized protein (UPF0332 family)